MKLDNILGDQIGSLELVDSMGGDLQVVNSARVSYGKEKRELDEKDIKLIRRLIKDKHVSVLRSTVMTFRCKVPMAIRNQWYKHIIGCAYASDQLGFNEVSRRYTAQDIEFYFPKELRAQDPNNKQSSSGLVGDQSYLQGQYTASVYYAVEKYQSMIQRGVAREQSRMVLPQCLYTEFLWTASLQAVLHFVDLRNKPDSQWEIQRYAQGIIELAQTVAPETIKIWQEEGSL